MATAIDLELMQRALVNASRVRFITSPNPWVGAVVAAASGELFDGATRPPGGPHAERVALDAAGDDARGATMYVTLEPCGHTGNTPPCTEALLDAGIERVVVGVVDPDPEVAGRGVEQLRRAGIQVEVGVAAAQIEEQLRPYLHHRRTGRPFVVLKLAATFDGRTAAPDGTSQWITGSEARASVHRLRAESDAILVGAGTIRIDDPSLTVRDWSPAPGVELGPTLDPQRVVLGSAPSGARARPCLELSGSVEQVLDQLGARGVLQLLVEGGAVTAAAFHRARLIDRYELFLAPALFGGNDGRPLFVGQGAQSIADLWRGRVVDLVQVGSDVHVSLEPER